ncbi:MAG: hypothetical protein WD530_05535 [Vicingaceae bacterium]
MLKNYYLLATLLLIIVLASCKKEELKADIPAYIQINDFVVLDNDSTIVSDNIQDAWVYIDDQLHGVFELPAIIPIPKTNKQFQLTISPGILNNLISNQRSIYPFYESFQLDTILEAEKVYQFTPAVHYRPNTVFDDPWSGEDFESGINFDHSPQSDTTFIRETNPELVFSGLASGAAYLAPGMDFFEASTPIFGGNDIPRGTSPVYLELNYRCSHDIVISIYVNNRSQQFSVVNLRAQANWNKAYIELRTVFGTLFDASNYSIAIGYAKPPTDEGVLLVDDIKLLHF